MPGTNKITYINNIMNQSILNTSKSRGFTLIEVMVALVIFSIGLLGLASLQGTSLQQNHGAYMRTQATYAAYDILDRMRANKNEATNYDVGTGTFGAPSPLCNSASDTCSQAEIRNADRYFWKEGLKTLLPLGDGSIATTSLGGRIEVTIRVLWDNTRSGTASTSSEIRAEL